MPEQYVRSSSVNTRCRKRSPCRSRTPRMRSTSMMSVPSPIRMPPGGREMFTGERCEGVKYEGFSLIHPRLHFPYRFLDAAKQRPAHDAVPDVQLVQVRQGSDFRNVHVIDAVPGVHHELEIMRPDRA